MALHLVTRRVVGGLTSVALCLLAHTSLAASDENWQVTINAVTTTTFFVGGPSVNAHGAVAFEDGFGSAIYSNAHGAGVGPFFTPVREGDVVPGALGVLGSAGDSSLNDDGSLVFRGFGVDSAIRGIYLYLSSGAIKLVADGSTRRPGSHETFTSDGPTAPVTSGGRFIMFSHTTATTSGVYRAEYDSQKGTAKLKKVIDIGSRFVGVPGNQDPLDYAMSSDGRIAMILGETNFGTRVFGAAKPGQLRLLATDGDQTRDCESISIYSAASINASGSTIFNANCLNTVEVNSILLADRKILIKVIDSTAEVPNHSGVTFEGFSHAYLADNGLVVFEASYRLGDQRVQGIYAKTPRGSRIETIFDQADGLIVNGNNVSLIGKEMGVGYRFAAVDGDMLRVAFRQRLDEPNAAYGIFVATVSFALWKFDSH